MKNLFFVFLAIVIGFASTILMNYLSFRNELILGIINGYVFGLILPFNELILAKLLKNEFLHSIVFLVLTVLLSIIIAITGAILYAIVKHSFPLDQGILTTVVTYVIGWITGETYTKKTFLRMLKV